jgi:polyphosphate glucokinase
MADTILLGLDVGGSSIKAGLVDTGRGSLTTPLLSVPTPAPSTPEAVLQACARIDSELGGAGPVGLAFPSVVQGGIARTAANVDKSWIGFAGGKRLSQLIGRPVMFLNDADAAGVAEMSSGGAGKDAQGVVMLLTFGTGIGSALFTDGVLVANTELGHLELEGFDAEKRAAESAREREGLSWAKWAERVQVYLAHLEMLFSPDLFIVGGGASKHPEKWIPRLELHAPVRVAAFGNNAGILGAALVAEQSAPVTTPP